MSFIACAFWACGAYAADVRGYGFWPSLCWPGILIGGIFDYLNLRGKKASLRDGDPTP